MTIKFGNFANFIVRNFVVMWEAPVRAEFSFLDGPSWEFSVKFELAINSSLTDHFSGKTCD